MLGLFLLSLIDLIIFLSETLFAQRRVSDCSGKLPHFSCGTCSHSASLRIKIKDPLFWSGPFVNVRSSDFLPVLAKNCIETYFLLSKSTTIGVEIHNDE